MSKNSAFFREERQAAAVLKHGILRRYLPQFAGMVGSTSPSHTVGYLDAYAGSGSYVHPVTGRVQTGSPKIALEIASNIQHRDLWCTFIEKNRAHHSSLKNIVEASGLATATTLRGDVAVRLDEALERFADMPLLVLLDPFGTALETHLLVDKILGRQSSWATEVLLNFSIDAVRRIGARYYQRPGSRGRDASISRLDSWLGGDWWQSHFESRASNVFDRYRASGAAADVFDSYVSRIRKQADFEAFAVPIRRHPQHVPIFNLTLFYKRNYAVMPFNEAVSLAVDDWRAHLRDLELTAADLEDYRNPTLPGLSRVRELEAVFADDEIANREELIQLLERSITQLLLNQRSISVRNEFRILFNDVIGSARTTHLREAWKRVAATGGAFPPPRGSLDAATIHARSVPTQ